MEGMLQYLEIFKKGESSTKKIIALLATLVISLTACVVDIQETESGDLQELINSIKIEDDQDVYYDRSEWTSSSQLYLCNNHRHDHNRNSYTGDDDGKFTSIRAYAYYESVWYDWDNDVYTDPYTGYIIKSVKETDYDHIIPLAYANAHGGSEWSGDKKKEYSDDPSVGVCCNKSENCIKGAKGPSEWLPKENQDDYCYTWLVIANKYDLSISQDDIDVILSCIDGDEIIINALVE